MLAAQAYTDLRNYLKQRLKFAQYRVGGTWYNCPIVETVITNDGIVRIKCQIAHGAACTITGVQLLNSERQIWATKSVNVVIETASTNLMQWFDFTFEEKEVS